MEETKELEVIADRKDDILVEILKELRISNRLRAIELNANLSPTQMGQDYAFLINMQTRPIDPDV